MKWRKSSWGQRLCWHTKQKHGPHPHRANLPGLDTRQNELEPHYHSNVDVYQLWSAKYCPEKYLLTCTFTHTISIETRPVYCTNLSTSIFQSIKVSLSLADVKLSQLCGRLESHRTGYLEPFPKVGTYIAAPPPCMLKLALEVVNVTACSKAKLVSLTVAGGRFLGIPPLSPQWSCEFLVSETPNIHLSYNSQGDNTGRPFYPERLSEALSILFRKRNHLDTPVVLYKATSGHNHYFSKPGVLVQHQTNNKRPRSSKACGNKGQLLRLNSNQNPDQIQTGYLLLTLFSETGFKHPPLNPDQIQTGHLLLRLDSNTPPQTRFKLGTFFWDWIQPPPFESRPDSNEVPSSDNLLRLDSNTLFESEFTGACRHRTYRGNHTERASHRGSLKICSAEFGTFSRIVLFLYCSVGFHNKQGVSEQGFLSGTLSACSSNSWGSPLWGFGQFFFLFVRPSKQHLRWIPRWTNSSHPTLRTSQFTYLNLLSFFIVVWFWAVGWW